MEHLLAARGVLLDLDGTLVTGGACLPGAAALVAKLGERCAIVSNNAEHTPAQLSFALRRIGLKIPARRILLAGAFAIDELVREQPNARVMLLGSSILVNYARRRGLQVVRENTDVVLLGRDRRFSYEKLQSAARAVRAGAMLVARNPDLTHPGQGRSVVPETGALLAALLACTGDVPFKVIGKPQPALFQAGMALLGTTPKETIIVGDNPGTDGAGAKRLGIGFWQADTTGFVPSAVAA